MHMILKDASWNKSVERSYIQEEKLRTENIGLRLTLLLVKEEGIELMPIKFFPHMMMPGRAQKSEATSIVTTAIDDIGKDLLRDQGVFINLALNTWHFPFSFRTPIEDQKRERYRHLNVGGEVAGDAHINLPAPDPRATKLDKLEGYVTVTQVLERKTLEVKPLEEALGKALEFENGGRKIQFTFTKCEEDKVYYTISVSDFFPKPDVIVRFFDNENKEVMVTGGGCRGHKTQYDGEYRIARPLGPGGYAVIDYSARQEDVRVPFAFTDVPLPASP